jgi:phage-related tail fiber protein
MLLFGHCNKEEIAAGADKILLEEASASTGFTYYRNNTGLLAGSQNIPHKAFFKVRFNAVAQSALDSMGKLPASAVFPQGSLIVKELYDSESAPLSLYAIMKKDSADGNAASGWMWAEIRPDEKVVVSVTKKGASCVNCHSMNARDYTRIFDIY